MKPRFETLPEKKLVGRRLRMSLAEDKTGLLWRSFMPRRNEIQNKLDTLLYSMQVYDALYFDHFSPEKIFEKWAAIEVEDFDEVPDNMESYTLPGGRYAVFLHKGANTDTSTYQYIFTSWLPGSNYLLDNRPHFELLGDMYQNGDPNSEEEIWIPIRPR